MDHQDEKTKWADPETNAFSADSAAPGHDNLYDEEYAAEISAGPAIPRNVYHVETEAQETRETRREVVARSEPRAKSRGGMWGAIALLAAIASWIVWPTVMATVAIVAGIVAFAKGSKSLGGWSIALGIISFLVFMYSAYY